MNGKGDKRRPQRVDNKTFESNWDRIFGNKDRDLKYESDNPLERPFEPNSEGKDGAETEA